MKQYISSFGKIFLLILIADKITIIHLIWYVYIINPIGLYNFGNKLCLFFYPYLPSMLKYNLLYNSYSIYNGMIADTNFCLNGVIEEKNAITLQNTTIWGFFESYL